MSSVYRVCSNRRLNSLHSDLLLIRTSSLYNGTVVVYDPYKAKVVDTIILPDISFNPVLHVGGVDYDHRTGLFYIVADAGAPFNTNGKDITGPNYVMKFDPITKDILWTVDLTIVTQERYSGFQDLEEDAQGNVFVVGTWPASILRISGRDRGIRPWYVPEPLNQTRKGLSGIAAKDDNLLAYDINGGNGGKLLRFNMTAERGVPVEVPLTPPTFLGLGDAVYLPPKYDGKVLLISIDAEGTVVIVSSDGKWEKAEYKGLIPRGTTGDAAGSAITASVQIGQSIYTVLEWFDAPIPGSLAGNRTVFPWKDITAEVEALVKK